MSDTYEIKHIRDFLSVPEDRIEACLEEFRDWIDLTRSVVEMANVMGEVIGTKGEACTPDSFVWIDDGKRNKTAVFQVTNGKDDDRNTP